MESQKFGYLEEGWFPTLLVLGYAKPWNLSQSQPTKKNLTEKNHNLSNPPKNNKQNTTFFHHCTQDQRPFVGLFFESWWICCYAAELGSKHLTFNLPTKPLVVVAPGFPNGNSFVFKTWWSCLWWNTKQFSKKTSFSFHTWSLFFPLRVKISQVFVQTGKPNRSSSTWGQHESILLDIFL